MNLYEALKSGKSVEELAKQFQDEMDAAQKRIKEESVSEQELNDCRNILIGDLIIYIKLLGKKCGFDEMKVDKEELRKLIKYYEDHIGLLKEGKWFFNELFM